VGTQPAKFLLKKGTVLNGKWEVLDPIAKGGMAEIYRARQINLDREVALKVISDEFLESFDGDEEEIRATLERFRREVMMMAQVRHPTVLQVYDSGQTTVKREGDERQVHYIAMEYVAGTDLRFTMPAEGFRHDERAIRRWSHDYLLPILDGVETLHALGIVHRDLKPENILLDGQTPRIADFGIAGGHRWQRVTRSHHIVGTVPYQAGEQFLDMGETDVRADVYSLGKILYEAVSGRMVSKETAFPWRTAHLLEADTPFLRRLDRIVRQATAEDRNQRTPTVGALRQSLLEVIGAEGEAGAGSLETRSAWLLHWKPRALIAALALVAAAAVVTLILHLASMTQMRAATAQSSSSTVMLAAPSPGSKFVPTPNASNGTLASSLRGRDGAALQLVPAGEVTIARESESSAAQIVRLAPFYMDETEVTNHQFVEFLNQNLSKVAVQEGVVRGDGQIWLLLGLVKEGYEPVAFRDGAFHVKEPGYASYPVARVTAYGAAAYAQFFGRRLPSEAEWLLARRIGPGLRGSRTSAGGGSGVPASQAGAPGNSPMEAMQVQTAAPRATDLAPVLDGPPDGLGLRGLDGGVREWTTRLSLVEGGASAYVVMPSAVSRLPWEAFAEVGFRCALTP